MPQAESILVETIDVREGGMNDLESRALVERAYVAGTAVNMTERSVFVAALRNVGHTQPRPYSEQHRDGFPSVGLHDTARDAYLVLAATAQEQYVRWLAEINLMELAAQHRIELQFDKYRRDLEDADLTPFLRVMYLLHVGRGYHSLGKAEQGISYLEEAVEAASRYELNQLMFEAEAALEQARRRETKPIRGDLQRGSQRQRRDRRRPANEGDGGYRLDNKAGSRSRDPAQNSKCGRY